MVFLLAFAIFQENKYLTGGFYYGLGLIMLAVILQMIRVKITAARKPLSESRMIAD